MRFFGYYAPSRYIYIEYTFIYRVMRLYLTFFTVLTLSCAASSDVYAQVSPSKDCLGLNVEAETIHTRAGGDNAQIILKFEEPRQSEQYHIYLVCAECREPRRPVDLTFRDLKTGLYDIYVIGNDGCSKQFNIQVN